MITNADIEVDAVYRDGVLKPLQPLPLPDNTLVRLHIESDQGEAVGNLSKFKGILGGLDDLNIEDALSSIRYEVEQRTQILADRLSDDS